MRIFRPILAGTGAIVLLIAPAQAAVPRQVGAYSSDMNCVDIVEEAAQFAMQEAKVPSAPQSLPHEQLRRDLAGQSDPESFLTALLLEPSERRLPELATRAINTGSRLLAWHALRACAAARWRCPIPHLESKLLEIQQDNAEAWALVAGLRRDRGDYDGALAAMQAAAGASTSNWHWSETISVVEGVLAARTTLPYPQRLAAAFSTGYTAAIPDQSPLTRMCRVESRTNRAWAQACLAFGTLRGERNGMELAQSTALDIRLRSLEMREPGRADAVAAEQARFHAGQMAGGTPLLEARNRMLNALLHAGPPRMHDYLDAVRVNGDAAAAREFLLREAPPLMDRAGLLAREGVRECVAQLFVPARVAGADRLVTTRQKVRIADELYLTLLREGAERSLQRRVAPDGKVVLALPFDFNLDNTGAGLNPQQVLDVFGAIAAAGKTTQQIEQEIAAVFSKKQQPTEVRVVLVASRSREELRLAFDKAHRESVHARRAPR
jgi:hypothetical protein